MEFMITLGDFITCIVSAALCGALAAWYYTEKGD